MRKLIVNESIYESVRISAGKSAAEQYAAAELSAYLSKMGIPAGDGARIRISASKRLKRDAYAITVSEKGIRIAGGNGRGVLYGVYALLEKYAGARFFLPELETIGEGDIVVKEDCAHTPIFEYRQSDWPCGRDAAWSVKRGINDFFIPEEMGGRIKYGGFVHTMTALLGADQYKEQPCLSNPENLKKAIAGVRRILENDPTVTIVSVSQNDNQHYCTCEKCAAADKEEGSHMGSLLRFVNAVAADIAEDYPHVIIDTLAYQYTRKVPAITKPLPNVCIRLCSIECCFSHPLDEDGCPDNKAFRRDILAWNKICNRIYIWDYVTNFRYYVPTFPNFDVIRKNMRFFAEHGVKGMYPEGNFNSKNSGEFGELRCYLLARLMMDPNMSEQAYYTCMDEFLAAYYGEGWRYIRAYIDFTCMEAKGAHMHIYDHIFRIIPREKWEAMEETIDGWWDKAEAMAGDRLAFVRRSRFQWRYIKLEMHPDALEGKRFHEDVRRADVRWNERSVDLAEPDFSLPPSKWTRW